MSDKNIAKIKEYAKQQSVEDTIGMILSNRADFGGEQGAMVSVKQFNQVAKDLIEIFPQLKTTPLRTVVNTTERTQLTKTEALEALKRGEKIAHRYFAEHEYVKLTAENNYKFEDGNISTQDRFWEFRKESYWETGWYIFVE